MQYTALGRTGLLVSRLCLGTMEFGPKVGEEECRLLMDTAVDEGINFFDTANVYGRKLVEGASESIIGRWFGQSRGRRDKIVLATKVYGNMADWPNGRGLSARSIIAEANASLRRLDTDYIDLYQMHHVDRQTPCALLPPASLAAVSCSTRFSLRMRPLASALRGRQC